MRKETPIYEKNWFIFICEGCGRRSRTKHNKWQEELKEKGWEVFDRGQLCFCPKCRLNNGGLDNRKEGINRLNDNAKLSA